MRHKSELYHKQQSELCDEIINILDLDKDNSIILYYLDNDIEKQEKIMDLIGRIRTFFTYRLIRGLVYPENCKRPWLTIIKHMTKIKYKLEKKVCYLKVDNERFRSVKYIFNPLELNK